MTNTFPAAFLFHIKSRQYSALKWLSVMQVSHDTVIIESKTTQNVEIKLK